MLGAQKTRQTRADLHPTEEGRATVEERWVLHEPQSDPKILCIRASDRTQAMCDLCSVHSQLQLLLLQLNNTHKKESHSQTLLSHRAAPSLGDFPSTLWTRLSFQNQRAMIASLHPQKPGSREAEGTQAEREN